MHCQQCGLDVVGAVIDHCPRCSGELIRTDAEVGDDHISISVAFAQFRCDTCGQIFVIDTTGTCPGCGHPELKEGSADPRAEERLQRWGPAIRRISTLARSVRPSKLKFSSRGRRRPAEDHVEWLRARFFVTGMDSFNEAKRVLSSVNWPALDREGDVGLAKVEAAVSTLVDFTREAQASPPPAVLIAVHRGTAQGAAAVAESLALFAEVIVAPTLGEASRVRDRAQARLDEAVIHASAISANIQLAERVGLQPGWFAWDDRFDAGRATAELVGHRRTTVADVAAQVRATFAGVSEIATLPDPLAFALGPAALTSVLWDPQRLKRRIRTVLAVMAQASEVNPNWLTSVHDVAKAILDGHRKLNQQVGSLGFVLRSNAPRKQMLLNATTVFERFAEGPMRKFGSILRQAIEVSEGRQHALDPAALVEDKFGYVTDSLQRATPTLVHDLETLTRNAAAHYEFEITESGIDITEPMRQGKKRSASLTDDDFLEMLFDLNEAIVGLEVGLIVYAASNPLLRAEIDQLASGSCLSRAGRVGRNELRVRWHAHGN